MNLEDYEPEYAYQFLSGIVSTGVCVVFETNEILTKVMEDILTFMVVSSIVLYQMNIA